MEHEHLHGQSAGARVSNVSGTVSSRRQVSLPRVTRSPAILTLAAYLTLLAPLSVHSQDAMLRGGSQTAHITGGKGWQILRNSRTGLPELMFGSRSRPLGSRPLEAGGRFLSENKEILGVDPSTLRVVRVVPFTDAYYVYYQQTHNGMDVLGGELILSLSRTGEVLCVKSTYVPGISAPEAPLVGVQTAREAAAAHLGARTHRLLFSELVIYPKDYGRPAILAWRLGLAGEDPVSSRVYLVDASTGQVLRWHDTRVPIEGIVRGKVFPANGGDPYQEVPFPYHYVRVGQTEVVTDTDGKYRTDAEGLISAMLRGPYFDVITLEPNLPRPIYASRQDPSWTWEFDRTDPRADDVNVFWHLNRALRYFDRYLEPRLGTYIDSLKSPLDVAMSVSVRRQEDNAFFQFYRLDFEANPDTDELVFQEEVSLRDGEPVQVTTSGVLPGGLERNTTYWVIPTGAQTIKLALRLGDSPLDITTKGTGTHSIEVYHLGFGLIGSRSYARDASVIYHEYAHGVVWRLTEGIWFEDKPEAGALNEALADYFAASIGNDPRIGDWSKRWGAIRDLSSKPRSYADRGICSADTLLMPDYCLLPDGEQPGPKNRWGFIHHNSLIFSGALWEAGQEIGLSKFDSIVLRSLAWKPTSFPDGVAYLLLADDQVYGDGDLSNGSPHSSVILQAFNKRDLFSSLPTSVTLSEGLRILRSEPSFVGDKLTATFAIRNAGPTCVVLRALTVGGRDS